ncbi:uncharacterized protein FAM241A [Austrofundulus limnaeus]|uniref:Uncharacterized protein FAM241A n=1 Tax=Austrofundulus limnaeus TaxID=52670 RepID=A0A2I4BHS7_AUSLI|nr:PREDICTED: uncharacterized protein C4orf32 homolog [Austrofundulus limnaeus]
MSAVSPPADGHPEEDLPSDIQRRRNHHAQHTRGERHAVRLDAERTRHRLPGGAGRTRPRPPSEDEEAEDEVVSEPKLDDCERMGSLFGMINKCLLGLGFSQMYFGDRTVEPVVILIFWMLLWFLGFQALGLVGTLCIIIIYIQK